MARAASNPCMPVLVAQACRASSTKPVGVRPAAAPQRWGCSRICRKHTLDSCHSLLDSAICKVAGLGTDAAAPHTDTAGILRMASPSQLLEVTLHSGCSPASVAAGSGTPPLYLEVLRCRPGAVEAACCGELLQLSSNVAGELQVSSKGSWPRLSEPWVKQVPGLADSLKKLQQRFQQDRAAGCLPSHLLLAAALHAPVRLQALQSLADFQAAVAAAPQPWCDGTGPGDPAPTQQQAALLTAGELAAFLQGRRGVCLVQLYKGWGDSSAAAQPLLRPWVLTMLQRAAADKGIAMLLSAVSGAEQLGTTVVLCARQQPFHAWGKHLASQHVQSSIVADSPFYKLLIGRILGYKEENIHHHIQSTGGSLTEAVIAAVDAELAGLSAAQPKLPWSAADKRRK